MQPRTICWFSCGASSAVAAKLALIDNPDAEIIYTEVIEEHSDNRRFLNDCEKWLKTDIKILRNDEYGASIYEVFSKTRFLVGPTGAACTRLLKKQVRHRYEWPGDVQVFGFTHEEIDRAGLFRKNNPDVLLSTPLIDRFLTKPDCLAMIERAGIELPKMYQLGYRNNNCIGCVKGGAGYWNKIRVDFPEVFSRMSDMETELGRSICKITVKGEQVRVPLAELPANAGSYEAEPDISCGLFCVIAEEDICSQ